MNQVKELFRRNIGVLACFYVLAQIDVYLGVGFPETIKQVVGTTLLAVSIAFLCLAIPVFFLRFRRSLAYIELSVLAVFEAIKFVARVRFDTGINGTWVLLLMGTSWRELYDCLLASSLFFVCLVFSVVTAFCVIGWRIMKVIDCERPKRLILRVLLMFTFVMPYFIMVSLYRLQGNETTYIGGFSVASFLVDSVKKCKMYFVFRTIRGNHRPCSIKVSETDLRRNPIYVFGIGESLTRNHMSLYGYGRKTTPELDAMKNELVVYTDCIARYRTTELSVSHTYVHFDRAQTPEYTLPQILQSAGYNCVHLSMQRSWSSCSVVDGVLFYGVETDGGYYEHGEQNYDDKLLTLLQDAIVKHRNQPLAVFLHFYGSHFDHAERYPRDTATVYADDYSDAYNANVTGGIQKFNQYDNSVHYSDMILAKVIKILSETKRTAFFVFCSDHGESPSSLCRRKSDSRDVWEIPLFFWFSSEYRALYPQKVAAVERCKDMPLQSDQLFGGFLSLLHITPPPPPHEDFLSPQFRCRKKRVVDEGEMDYGVIRNRSYEK